jgi:hypothetical protein
MQQGYLIIADISGYTAYLTGTELAHAQDILSKLIQTILDIYRPPIELVELEGDAGYVYLPGSDASAQTLLDVIEGAYFAFARQRDSIAHVAPCVCAACRNVPLLDLKFVVHFGEFAVQRLAGRAKPIGPDVILVHRLLKNQIADVMGTHAYVFFTDAALQRAGLDAAVLGLRRHHEEYEHLGEVSGAVLDLVPRGEQERALRRVRLDAAAARSQCAVEVAAPARGRLGVSHAPGASRPLGARPGRHRGGRQRACPRRARRSRPGWRGARLAAVQVLHREPPARHAAYAEWRVDDRANAHARRHARGLVCAPAEGLRASLGFTLGRGKLLASQEAGGDRLRAVLGAEWAPSDGPTSAAAAEAPTP